jgi:hypothetical protein
MFAESGKKRDEYRLQYQYFLPAVTRTSLPCVLNLVMSTHHARFNREHCPAQNRGCQTRCFLNAGVAVVAVKAAFIPRTPQAQ